MAKEKLRGMQLGSVGFTGIGGFQEDFVSSLLDSRIAIKRVRFENGIVSGIVSPLDYYFVSETARKNGVRLKSGRRRGLYFTAMRYRTRLGLYVGLLAFISMLSFMKTNVADISIIGDVSKTQIMQILSECGIEQGKPLVWQSCSEAEQRIMTECDNVAWTDVSATGFRVSVRVETGREPPEIVPLDKPCNLVAARDAVIVGHTVRRGALSLETYSGVQKGGLLVSGVVTDGAGNTRFEHADAEIIGEFSETQTFFVPFSETIKIADGEGISYNYIEFLDDIYPLFFGEAFVADAVYSEETRIVSLFGMTTPLTLRTGTYTKYRSLDITRTNADCTAELKRQKSAFEENFYSDFTIVNAEEKYFSEKDGIRLEVAYILHGDIAEERPIELL